MYTRGNFASDKEMDWNGSGSRSQYCDDRDALRLLQKSVPKTRPARHYGESDEEYRRKEALRKAFKTNVASSAPYAVGGTTPREPEMRDFRAAGVTHEH